MNSEIERGGDDPASHRFRAFVKVLTGARAATMALGEAEAQAGAAALSAKLCQLIELQSLEAGRLAGKGNVDLELRARFLKAALADEMMLRSDWAGRAHWRHVLVEATLFRTAHAGQQVFADIDQLLTERDPSRRPLARLYLYLLALGFQGRYRGGDQLDALAGYRRALFQFAWQRAPGMHGANAVLSDQPYASTLSFDNRARLARPSRGAVAWVAIMLAMLALSEGLWLWQSEPVRDALANKAPDEASTAATAGAR
jgi:type VI secretion system protein ImpK